MILQQIPLGGRLGEVALMAFLEGFRFQVDIKNFRLRSEKEKADGLLSTHPPTILLYLLLWREVRENFNASHRTSGLDLWR